MVVHYRIGNKWLSWCYAAVVVLQISLRKFHIELEGAIIIFFMTNSVDIIDDEDEDLHLLKVVGITRLIIEAVPSFDWERNIECVCQSAVRVVS